MFRNLKHESQQIFNAVMAVPDEAAAEVSDLFKAIAHQLDIKNHEHIERQKRSMRSIIHLQDLNTIPLRIQNELSQGKSFSLAKLSLAKKYHPDTIQYHWKKHQDEAFRRNLKRRNWQIYTDYQAQHRTHSIAQKYGLSTRQIQRIVKDLHSADHE